MHTHAHEEILRSSYTCQGMPIFLIFDEKKSLYRLATRWYWLTAFDNVYDACDAFEAIGLMEGDEKHIAKILKTEIKRVPRYKFGLARNTMGRINYLINSAERRLAGLRPVLCGSKGAIEKWVPVRA